MKSGNGLLIAVFMCLLACTPTDSVPPADIIFLGENIVTVDETMPAADAVAVRGEEIVAVGNRADVLAYQGPATRVVELGDRALVPGFIDAHGHMAFVGRLMDFVNLSSPPVGPVQDMGDVIELLRQHIERTGAEPGTWVFGYGYDDSLIAENRHPTRDDLDKASTEHPIALMHVSGHLAAANSAALLANEVDATTDDPPGGVIRRRANSREPNGVLEETAVYPFIFKPMRNADPARVKAQMREAADQFASYGVTTVQDGLSNPADVALFREVAAAHGFPVDVVAFPSANALDDETLASVHYEKAYKGGFRVGGIKFTLDGSPQGRTAFLTEPYHAGPPGADADYRAYPTYPGDEFNRRVATLIDVGMPVLVHANGDAAIDMVIDGVEQAVKGEELPDHRTVVIHAQLTREDQLHKFKELGLVPSYYSVHPFFWGDWHRKSFGEERAAFISPVGRTVELGIPFTVHNDSPVVPPDMMRLMWITVNRKTRSGFVLGPEQRATPMQALHAITLGAAYQYFEEDRKGSITPGKRADLVILGANPLTADPDTIKDIPIIETISRGESVWP